MAVKGLRQLAGLKDEIHILSEKTKVYQQRVTGNYHLCLKERYSRALPLHIKIDKCTHRLAAEGVQAGTGMEGKCILMISSLEYFEHVLCAYINQKGKLFLRGSFSGCD